MKKNLNLIVFIFICCLLLFACKQKRVHQPTSPADSTLPAKEEMVNSDTARSTAVAPSNADLLQGKWRHTEDTSNYLVFEKNHRKEIAKGTDVWDDEAYVLADRCMNASNKASPEKAEAASYISCPESDLCWYILTLDSVNLSLSYMGRGNILQYRRVQ